MILATFRSSNAKIQKKPNTNIAKEKGQLQRFMHTKLQWNSNYDAQLSGPIRLLELKESQSYWIEDEEKRGKSL
jgi:hypothetical protein